jgi:hypothetical protein
MIVNKGASLHNGESIVSSTNGAGEMDTHMQRKDIGHLSYCVYKILTQNGVDANI